MFEGFVGLVLFLLVSESGERGGVWTNRLVIILLDNSLDDLTSVVASQGSGEVDGHVAWEASCDCVGACVGDIDL